MEELRSMLEERENDLQLAGELGKALLEKNEELTREYDRTCQDYHCKIEVSCACIWTCATINVHLSLHYLHGDLHVFRVIA